MLPPEARAGVPGLKINPAFNKSQSLDSQSAESLQDILTAIPVGERWCIKALLASGEVVRVGSFDSRLAALGSAVLLAEHVGATVVP
jgi:hypothetical protein